MGANRVELIRHLVGLRGRSKPFIAEANDGVLYVVKYADLSTELFSLFCESIGTILLGALGLPVPEWRPLLLTESFLGSIKDIDLRLALKGHRSRSQLVFGSRYLGREFGRVLEILPSTDFGRLKNRKDFWLVWLLDVCAHQTDNRQAMFCELADRRLSAHFIDHGSLFDTVNEDLHRQIVAAMYLDRRIYQGLSSLCLKSAISSLRSIDSDLVLRRAQCVPEAWLSVKGLQRLSDCLGRISTSGFVQRVSDGIAEIVEKDKASERGKNEKGKTQPASLLRPGL